MRDRSPLKERVMKSIYVVALNNGGLWFEDGQGRRYLSEPGDPDRSARLLTEFHKLGWNNILSSGLVDHNTRNLDLEDWEEYRRKFLVKPAYRINGEWQATNTVGWG